MAALLVLDPKGPNPLATPFDFASFARDAGNIQDRTFEVYELDFSIYAAHDQEMKLRQLLELASGLWDPDRTLLRLLQDVFTRAWLARIGLEGPDNQEARLIEKKWIAWLECTGGWSHWMALQVAIGGVVKTAKKVDLPAA